MSTTSDRAARVSETIDRPAGGERSDRPVSKHQAQRRRADALTGGERRLLVSLLVGFAAVPILVAILALLGGWHATGDNAIIGIQVRSLLDGNLPLIGQPTTGENFGSGVESSHPGPMAMYLLAPFVAVLGGTVGLAIGAAAINGAAWVLAGWASFRRGGLVLLACTGVAFCLLARSLGPFILADPISSNLGTFPSVAFALLAWAVLAGDRDLLPWCVIVGTFTIQAHLTYVAWGAGIVAVLGGGLAFQGWQERRGPAIEALDRPPRFERRTWMVSLYLGILLWLPVVLDQLVDTGNITSLLKTFTSGESVGKGVAFAFERFLYAVGVVPVWIQRVRGLDFLRPLPIGSAITAVAVVALLVAVGWWPVRGRVVDSAMRRYALVVAGVAVTSLYSAVSLPEPASVKASNLRWMWTLGLLVWLGAVGGVIRAVAIVRGARVVRAIPIGLLVVAALAVSVEAANRPPRDSQVRDVVVELRSLAARTPSGTYKVVYEGNVALLTVGPAFAFELADNGSKVYVDAGMFTRAYGTAAGFDGQQVDGTFLVVTGEDVTMRDGFEEEASTRFEEKPGSDRVVEVLVGFAPGG